MAKRYFFPSTRTFLCGRNWRSERTPMLAVITGVFDAPDVAVAARAFRDAFASRSADTHAGRHAESQHHCP